MIKNSGVSFAPLARAGLARAAAAGLAVSLLAVGGCATKPAPARRVERPQPATPRYHSPEELGWQLVEADGSTHVRWKESIAPPHATQLPLMPPVGPYSVTPRVAAILNSKLVVPVTFDTGSPVNVFSAEVAGEAGFKFADRARMATVFQGVAGSKEMDYALVESARMSGLEIKGMLTAVHPARKGAKMFEIDYLVGMTTIAKFSYVTFDFPSRSMVVSVSDRFPGVEGPDVVQVPFQILGEQIVVEIQVNKEFAIEAFVDTGSDAPLLIGQRMAADLELADELAAGKRVLLGGLGGTAKAVSCQVERLDIGGKMFPKAEVVVVENDFPAGLGCGFLSQFKATFDFSRSILWLEKAP